MEEVHQEEKGSHLNTVPSKKKEGWGRGEEEGGGGGEEEEEEEEEATEM